MFRKISSIEALNTESYKTMCKALKSKDASVKRIAEGRFLITFINDHLNNYSNATLAMDAAKARMMDIVESNEFESTIWSDYIALDTDLLKLVGEIRTILSSPIKMAQFANLVGVLRDTTHALGNIIQKYGRLASEEFSRNPESTYKPEMLRKLDKIGYDMAAHIEISHLIDHTVDLFDSKDNFVVTPNSSIMLTTAAYNEINRQ
jgi:hypothetical protein|tara:strand:+ start:174 stop:788 length:615 start_codon:yes stop_codon:yes gene_type:complete